MMKRHSQGISSTMMSSVSFLFPLVQSQNTLRNETGCESREIFAFFDS